MSDHANCRPPHHRQSLPVPVDTRPPGEAWRRVQFLAPPDQPADDQEDTP